MTRRALESAYIRIILDESYEEVIRAYQRPVGLDSNDVAALRAIPTDALKVERRGRWRELWERARSQMPWTVAYLEAHEAARDSGRAKLLRDYFGHEFWSMEDTLSLPPWGPGSEMATSLKAFLHRRALQDPRDSFRLCADLACIEWNRFSAICTTGMAEGIIAHGHSNYDVFRVIHEPAVDAVEIRLETPLEWVVLSDGSVGQTRGRNP